jgi:vanillate O-demethylase monooxygenase subunit
MFTPESNTTSHYFYCNSRDYGVDSDETDARVRGILDIVFGSQDRPMIEAQQNMIGDHDLMSLRPVVLPTDRASVLVRRRLAQLIGMEQAQNSPSTPTVDGSSTVAATMAD